MLTLSAILLFFLTSSYVSTSPCLTLDGVMEMNIDKKDNIDKNIDKKNRNKEHNINNTKAHKAKQSPSNDGERIQNMLSLISEKNPKINSAVEWYRMYVFFDYNCSYCGKTAHAISGMKNKNNLNINFIESPVLGHESVELSKISIAVFKLYPEKYKDFHRIAVTSTKIKKAKDALKLAKNMDIDVEKIKMYIEKNSSEILKTISENKKVAYEISKSNTVPLIVLNNKILKGSVSSRELDNIISQIPPLYNTSITRSKISNY